jgi:SAM-dependent methyltransferase
MATDIKRLIANLSEFYPVTGKSVIDIGAGGGQLVEFMRPARRVLAIDSDPAAVRLLEQALAARDLGDRVTVRQCDFFALSEPADVVFFEFCLHEMPDPDQALAHARTLAADVLVADHAPDSEWAFYGAEDDKVRRSYAAMQAYGPRRQVIVAAEQHFPDHAALLARIAGQGPIALERCASLAGQAAITIPMRYSLTLL